MISQLLAERAKKVNLCGQFQEYGPVRNRFSQEKRIVQFGI